MYKMKIFMAVGTARIAAMRTFDSKINIQKTADPDASDNPLKCSWSNRKVADIL
jgi:hypothetical protein